jgi:hypothetical protein
MTREQCQRIAAQPERYLDGSLVVHARVCYDRDPGEAPPSAWAWGGDGWYASAVLIDVRIHSDGDPRLDVNLADGGQENDYHAEDIVILDTRFPELLSGG